MSISVKVDEGKKRVEIQIFGSFDFSLFNDFRASYIDYADSYRDYLIDMKAVEYLDSAALGMLLSMRSAVGGEDANITIANANEFIKNILMISRFDKRFTIT